MKTESIVSYFVLICRKKLVKVTLFKAVINGTEESTDAWRQRKVVYARQEITNRGLGEERRIRTKIEIKIAKTVYVIILFMNK